MAKDKAVRKASEATVNVVVPVDLMTRLEDGPVVITIELVLCETSYKGQRRTNLRMPRPKLRRAPKSASGDAA